jgi:chorismate mutase
VKSDANQELSALRGQLDNLNATLIYVLAERFKCTSQIGLLKARAGFPPVDERREAEQRERIHALCREAGLDPAFAIRVFDSIVDEAVRNHVSIRANVVTRRDV